MRISLVIATEYDNASAFSVASGFLSTIMCYSVHVKKRMETCVGGKWITLAHFHLYVSGKIIQCLRWTAKTKHTSIGMLPTTWLWASLKMQQLCCVWRKLSIDGVAGINAEETEKWGSDFFPLASCLELTSIFI